MGRGSRSSGETLVLRSGNQKTLVILAKAEANLFGVALPPAFATPSKILPPLVIPAKAGTHFDLKLPGQ